MPLRVHKAGLFVQGVDLIGQHGLEQACLHEAFGKRRAEEIPEADGGDDAGQLVRVGFPVQGIVGIDGGAAHGDVDAQGVAGRFVFRHHGVQAFLYGQFDRAGRIEEQVEFGGIRIVLLARLDDRGHELVEDLHGFSLLLYGKTHFCSRCLQKCGRNPV